MHTRSVRTTTRRVWSIVVVASAMLALTVASAGATEPEGDGVVARFETSTLNLASSWGEAQACVVWKAERIAECFRTEAAMDAFLADLDAQQRESNGIPAANASSTCSGYLRLYDGSSYGTPVLSLRDRYQWQNLSSFGFNQKVSSFKVGPCATDFADYANGGGGWYPWYLTEAYDQASSMISGWNNDVSSIYIN